MQMVEQGKLDLDTDVNTYLKTFQIPATYAEPITLRHIMTHTAGFEDGGLGYLIMLDPAKILPLKVAMEKYRPRRVNKPGAYASYSNYATALAGLMVENVSGTPFSQYIEDNIFKPLGMNNSSFVEPLPGTLHKNMAVGHKREAGVLKPQPFEIISSFAPAGALSSTATDMAKFMMAHLNNGRLGDVQILQADTAKLMHSVAYKTDDRVAGMNLGFYENFFNGHRMIGHGGDTFQFHSDLMIDKAENLGIYVSYMGDGGAKGRSKFVQNFYDQYYPQALEEITPPEDFNDRASRFAGTYTFWRHNESNIEKVLGIAGGLSVVPTGENTLMLEFGGEPRQFVEIDKNLFRQVDGPMRIVFGEDENGNIRDFGVDVAPFMEASRQPLIESSFFAKILPGISLLLFLTVWVGWMYRRKEFKTMSSGERTAVKMSMGVSGLNLIFVILFVSALSIYEETLASDVPTALYLTMILPNIAVLLAIAMVWCAVKCWQNAYWRLGRRIHFTLVTLAAVYMSWFFYYWNMLGIQIP
jgi:CubicO group peptidase (beta-lactamase class C family)